MLDSSRVKLVQLEATVASLDRTVEQLRKDICMMKADQRLAKAMKGVGGQSVANSMVMGEEEQAPTMSEVAAEAPADQLRHHEQQQRLRALEVACAQLRTGLSEVGCLAERTEETGAQLKQELLQLREQLGFAHGFRHGSMRTALLGGTAMEAAEAEAGGGPPPQVDCELSASDLSRVVLELQEAFLIHRTQVLNLQRHVDSAVENCSPECRVEDCSSECALEAASINSLAQSQPTLCAEDSHEGSGLVRARLEALEVKSAALRCNDMALCAIRERMDKLVSLQGDLSNTRQDVTDLHFRMRNLEDHGTLAAGKLGKAPSDINLQHSQSGHDVMNTEAVEDDARDANTAMRQETKLDEAVVRLSSFCKELTALRTTPGTATVGERALAADAAVNSKLDDVRGLLSSCLHHLRQGSTHSLSVADAVGETAATGLTQRLPQQQQLQPSAAGKRGPSPSATASSSGACNRRLPSQSAGQRLPTVAEQRRSSPSRTRQQQGRSQSRPSSPPRTPAPGSPGGSQRPRRRPSAHPGMQEAKDERHAMSPLRARERSPSIPAESRNPMASASAAAAPSGVVRHTTSLSSTTATPASGVPAGSSTVVAAASSKRASVTVSRGRTLGALAAKQ